MENPAPRFYKCFPKYFVYLAAALLLAGCSSRFTRAPKPVPGSEFLISQGNLAFSRLDYQKAWEAYQKARALGVYDAVLFYRLAVLENFLKMRPSAGSIGEFLDALCQLMF